jgi:hypothetical protein
MVLNHSTLHFHIMQSFVDSGKAPSIDEMATAFQVSHAELTAALEHLQEYHGVVLHPKSKEVWVMHPFSAAPTNFFIQSGTCCWWGNCAWCSMGAAALLKRDLSITTTAGAESKQLIIHIKNGQIDHNNLLVHFPIPMQQAWDNVIYTCSNMLLFESEQDIIDWCQRHKMTVGDIQPLQRIWEFSQVWYGNHLRQDWHKWSSDEASALFQQFGLQGRIWELPVQNGRF